MNALPISNTSFKGYINIWNKPGDCTKKASYFEYGEMYTEPKELNTDINPKLSGKGIDECGACYTDEAVTIVNTDYIAQINPKVIVVRGEEEKQFGLIDIGKQDYNAILNAYTAASQKNHLIVDVNG